MPRKTGVDPVTAPEKEIGRLPVDVPSGGAIFEIHYAAPADAGSAKVIVAPELAARSLRSDASVYVVGEVGSDGILRVAEPDWVEAQSNRGESRAFYAVTNGAAFPFVEVEERRLVCSVPALHSLVVRCRDRSGDPIDGVRVSLSMTAVPAGSVESDFDHAVPLMSSQTASIHTAVTNQQGLATILALRPGQYCFDIAGFGFTRVAGPDPDRERLSVPAPGGEVEFVLGTVAIAAANIDADSILALRINSASSSGMLRARDEARILRHCRDRFSEFDIGDVRAQDSGESAESKVEVHALAVVDGRIAEIREAIDYVPLAEFRGPTEIMIDHSKLFDGGTLRVDLMGLGGQRFDDVRFALKDPSRSGPGLAQAVSLDIVGSCGQDLTIPVGEYSLHFGDVLLRRLTGEPAVVVTSGLRTDVRVTVPQDVVEYRVKLEVPADEGSLSGVSLRAKQDDCPVRIAGGDGVTEFGPYWGKPGSISVDIWAPGFVPVAHQAVLSGRRNVVSIPMTMGL